MPKKEGKKCRSWTWLHSVYFSSNTRGCMRWVYGFGGGVLAWQGEHLQCANVMFTFQPQRTLVQTQKVESNWKRDPTVQVSFIPFPTLFSPPSSGKVSSMKNILHAQTCSWPKAGKREYTARI